MQAVALHHSVRSQAAAGEIGVNYQTLRTARMVYTAWQGTPGAASITFGVLNVLASQPDRAEIVAATRELTVRKANGIADQCEAQGYESVEVVRA
jgi:hypothetical protein